ncbi:MAG: helix-turn-helix domain-containing protein [Pseudomonadota bacterium]
MQTIVRTTGQLGPVLRKLRKAKNWSQAQLGEHVGLSQERISAIENRPERIPVNQLLTLMMALDAELMVSARTPSETPTVEKGGW